MIRFLILFFLFFSAQVAHAKYAFVDVLRSSHQLDSSDGLASTPADAVGCIIPENDGRCKDPDDSSKYVPCNCPSGTKCLEQTGGKGKCQAQTKRVHIGGVNYDFEAANIIDQDAQMTHDTSLHAAFSTVIADGTAAELAKDKFPLYKVSIDGIVAAKFNAQTCTVSLTSLGSNDLANEFEVKSADDSSTDPTQSVDGTTVTCSFRLMSKGYLGNVNVEVKFNKDSTQLASGENAVDKVELHIRSAPSAADDQQLEAAKAFLFPQDAAGASSAADTESGAVFKFKLSGSDVEFGSGKKAEKGTLTLPIEGTFTDKRYKVKDISGIQALESDIGGNTLIKKEGLNIHNDYSLFYDSSRDSFDNYGVTMDPISSKGDYTGSLDFAEYKLKHNYVMMYGGPVNNQMPHFQPGYLGCTLCPAQLVVKLFPKSGVSGPTGYYSRYHAPIDASKLPTGDDKISMKNITAEVVTIGHGHRDQVAIRLPTSKTDGEHRLNEFFTFSECSGCTDGQFDSLDATYTLIDGRLELSDETKLSESCQSDSDKPIYQIGPDVTRATDLLDKCKITIEDTALFGDQLNITYDSKDSMLRINDARSVFSGNTELSILRRKTDSAAVTSGNKVTFALRKQGVSGLLNFTVKATNKARGWDKDGNRCTSPSNTAGEECYCEDDGSGNCVDSGAVYVDTDATDGIAKEHVLYSSPLCTTFFDIELEQVGSPWIVYALRLPCVATTETISDKLEIYHYFDSSYELSEDKFSANIGFKEQRAGNDFLQVLKKGFGGCGRQYNSTGTYDILSLVGGSCTQSWDKALDSGSATDGNYTLNGIDDGSGGTTDFDLEDLIKCDQGDVADDTDANYVIDHKLALIYNRGKEFGSGSDTEIRYETYCQEQDFSLTIRKDASASVSVNTLVSPTLERSVMVSDIDWIKCDASSNPNCQGNEDCYKLQIDLTSRKRNKVSGDAWANATLSGVEEKAGGADTDSMTVISSITSTATGNYFQLVGQCGPVVSCDSDAVGNSHYKNHQETKNELVLSGIFDNNNVDSDATIETAFKECPLDKTTENLGGELDLGLQLTCDDAQSEQDGAICDGEISEDGTSCTNGAFKKNCATAFQDAVVKVNATVFMDDLDTAGATEASDQGWELKTAKWYIRRYETTLTGAIDKSKLVSDDLIHTWARTSDSDAAVCSENSQRVQGLSLFDSTVLSCTVNDPKIGELKFDLQPLNDARMDGFEVHLDAFLQRGTSYRRLRASYTLQADPESSADSGSFRVIQASKDISEDALPSGGSDAPVSDSGKEDMSTETANDWLVVLIGCIAAGVLVLAGILFCACRRKDDMSAAIATTEEVAGLIDGRSQRFGNLRY